MDTVVCDPVVVSKSMHTKRHPRIIKLADKQMWLCCWCNNPMTSKLAFMHTATIEHVQPRSKGGSNNPTNLAASCYRCNTMRRDMCATQFAMMAASLPPDCRSVDQARQDDWERKAHDRQADRRLAQDAFDRGIRNPFEQGTRAFHFYCEIAAEHRRQNPPQLRLTVRLGRKFVYWLAPKLGMKVTVRK